MAICALEEPLSIVRRPAANRYAGAMLPDARRRIVSGAPRPRIAWILVLGTILLGLSACSRQVASDGEVTGEYVCKFKTGQLEVLSLEPNHTYIQRLFRSPSDFDRKAAPAFTSLQTWSRNGNSVSLQKCMVFADPAGSGGSLKFAVQKQVVKGSWTPPVAQLHASLEFDREEHVLIRDDSNNVNNGIFLDNTKIH